MPTVLVAGDVLYDNHLARQERAPGGDDGGAARSKLVRSPGGAWYLSRLVTCACSDRKASVIALPAQPTTPSPPESTGVAHAHALWEPFPRTADETKQRVWRMREFLGCQSVAKPLLSTDEVVCPDVLVLDDQGLGFSANERWIESVLAPCGGKTQIVLKTSPSGRRSPLLSRLLAPELACRLTIVVNVEPLRERGARISHGLSWERTLEELERELQEGFSARDLGAARRAVVFLNGAGAAIFEREQEGGPSVLGRLVYDPDYLEGAWTAERPGRISGARSLLVAALARHLLDPASYPQFIAVSRALVAIRTTHEVGGGAINVSGGREALAAFQPEAIEPRLSAIFHPPLGEPPPASPFRSTLTCRNRAHLGQNCEQGRSDFLRDLVGPDQEAVSTLAMQVVLRGPKKALAGVPSAHYGDFFTVDRDEIEAVNDLRQLLLGYLDNPKEDKPLSIAVFGKPGSGKSFAVKQLARSLFRGARAELEFNLSQFGDDIGDLHAAFHQVRDASVLGRVPLAFWDEFDTGGLRYLKEFLAPMQDGAFRQRGVSHRFGKAIFVFAGGTEHSFQAFRAKNMQAKELKAPDFISRVRGYLDIKGPNRMEDRPDPTYVLRRAILLRSALERFYPDLIDPVTGVASVSSAIIQGFLQAGPFEHGARSLETLVRASSLSGRGRFEVSDLPSAELVGLHAAVDFLPIIEDSRARRPGHAEIEQLAIACFEAWAREKAGQGYRWGPIRSDTVPKTHPDLLPWHVFGGYYLPPGAPSACSLPEERKDANRAPIPRRLLALETAGYRVEPCTCGSVGRIAPTQLPPNIQETLAEREHQIWLHEHALLGWEAGATTNDALRLHTDMCPFKQLPVEQSDINRGIVKTLLDALEQLGFVLVFVGDSGPVPDL